MPDPTNSLRLAARDESDLTVFGTFLQDALVPVGDIAWLKNENSLALAVNRFMWELPEQIAENNPLYYRTHSLLRIEHVIAVKTKGVNLGRRDQFLSVMSLQAFDGGIDILFAEGKTIRAETGNFNVILADMGQPWPTRWQPSHPEKIPLRETRYD